MHAHTQPAHAHNLQFNRKRNKQKDAENTNQATHRQTVFVRYVGKKKAQIAGARTQFKIHINVQVN